MTRLIEHAVQLEAGRDGALLLSSALPPVDPVASTGDWLEHWAVQAPDRVFMAERSCEGWREWRYFEALAEVRALAGGLLARGLGRDTPIVIISGNSIEHQRLSLAAQWIGVPTVPVAEQYAQIEAARPRLDFVFELIGARHVFADDAERYAGALARDALRGATVIAARNAGPDQWSIEALMRESPGDDALAAAHTVVGPESVAKILLTSGSTSNPKGVLTTQRMMCSNQAQIAAALPFLGDRPPVLVDWLPWNHVFGSSHNVNLVLANGGSLYIDDGKPVPALFPRTLENLARAPAPSILFNVPVGYAQLLAALREDTALAAHVFGGSGGEGLDMLFYAGASLPAEVWDGLGELARSVSGRVPMMTSSWGLTETAPAHLLQYQPAERAGRVGVPLPDCTVKLLPTEDAGRFEVRVAGPNVMPGYFRDPDKTRDAFDEEGFFITGDAMRWVDPDDPAQGLAFDGRLSEDFKLLSGTWVRAASLRLELLGALDGLAQDLVLTGQDRADVGLLVVPPPHTDGEPFDGLLVNADWQARIVAALSAHNSGAGSASRIARVALLAEPPSMGEGEITAKGNINFRKLLDRRAALVERLYAAGEPAVSEP